MVSAPVQRALPHIPVLGARIASIAAQHFAQTRGGELASGVVHVVDATVGAGGHSALLAEALHGSGWPVGHIHLTGIDRDATALRLARERLTGLFSATNTATATVTATEIDTVTNHAKPQISLIQGRFGELSTLIPGPLPTADVLVADLGVSSMQLDDGARGFSIRRTGPLDMRMDMYDVDCGADGVHGADEVRGAGGRSGALSAAELLQTADEQTLRTILEAYGEEPHAGRIAKAIVEYRTRHRRMGRSSPALVTTHDLAHLVERALPWTHARGGSSGGKGGGSGGSGGKGTRYVHPATRTFQALRIAVNEELLQLRDLVRVHAPKIVRPNGLFFVLSYHSLEDRLVKTTMRDHGPNAWAPLMKPLRPESDEIASNPRARSAILRAYIRSPQGDAPPTAESIHAESSQSQP